MKLREWLKKIRPRRRDDVERPVEDKNIDMAATMAGHGSAPAGWVPSQQDDRPRH